MTALDRKLFRDLWRIRGQALAIALVIASGVSIYVMYLSNADSLGLTQQVYYERFRMADVFASLKRAPLALVARVSEIPGVARAEARVVVDVTVDVPGLGDPAVGRLISIPERDEATLNDLFLREGRYLEVGRPDEVLVSEAFALANGLGPGDSVAATINGRRRKLELVGIVLSPEYVYGIRPGDIMPDDSRFGVLWMGRRALASAFDMEGGFNDVSLLLAPGANADDVIAHLDRLLRPYGGLGAVPRELQLSHWYVANELRMLENIGVIIPMIFLGVAVFLLNVVLNRIVAVEREQIAALKALGYSNAAIGGHYIRTALFIGLLGAGIGVGVGAWLGRELLELYNDFFRFPVLHYRLLPSVAVIGFFVSAAGAALGAATAVRKAAGLPPAEAMRPAPPAMYRKTIAERLGLGDLLPPPVRMVLRNIERQPARAALSCLGVGMAVAIMIAGIFMFDSMDLMMEQQFALAQRQDATISLVEPRSAEALHAVSRLPGALSVEPFRAVPVRLRHGHRSRQTSIMGLPLEPELNRVIGPSQRAIPLPPAGLMLSLTLAQILDLEAGDQVTVEVLVGAKPVRTLTVTRLVEEYLGTSVYMELDALRAMMREGPTLSGAFVKVAPGTEEVLYERIKLLPAVAGVSLKSAAIESFDRTVRDFLGVMLFFNLLFGGVIAFGVIYNSARIALSERSRELGSLRVLGFTRREIAAILLGELGTITLVAIPVGLGLGYGLSALASAAFASELYRIPLVISSRTYALAVFTVILATLVSGFVVRRKLYRLDLVAVLKTRE